MRADLAEQATAARAVSVERDRLAAELATVRAKAEAAEQLHQEQRAAAAQDAQQAADRLTKIEGERETARVEAGAAREDAAKLRGQVEALQKQAADLLHALEARQEIQADTPAAPATKAVRTKAKKGEWS